MPETHPPYVLTPVGTRGYTEDMTTNQSTGTTTHQNTTTAPSGRVVCTDCLHGAATLDELLSTECLASYFD